MTLLLTFGDAPRLVYLSTVDLVIIIFYFALVLAIGFYLKGQANTGEDFFMAGREMTAWIAGLSFLSANLGSLELMGWAGARLSIRHSGRPLVLDRRHSRHALSRAGDDAVLLHLQDALRARLSQAALRRAQPRAVRRLLRVHDRAHERHQYVLHGAGHEGRPRLGHQLQHLGLFRHRRHLCGPRRPAFRHLQ